MIASADGGKKQTQREGKREGEWNMAAYERGRMMEINGEWQLGD